MKLIINLIKGLIKKIINKKFNQEKFKILKKDQLSLK